MLSFKFGADGSEYSKGLDKMRNETKSWASSVKGLVGGAIGVTAIVSGFQKITEAAKEINKQALLFNTSTKAVQQLGGAAERAGFTFEDLADGMHDMTEKAQDAENGNKTYADAFKMMGLEARDFLALEGDFEGMLKLTADGLAHASEKGLDFLAANELMGGSAQKVLGTLRDGGDAFFAYAEGVEVMSEANIRAALKAEDAWLKVKNTVKGSANELGESVGSTLPFVEQIGKIGDAFMKIFPSEENLAAGGNPIKDFFKTLTGSFSNARKQAEEDAAAIEAAIAKTKPQTSDDGMFVETAFERSTRKEKEAKQAVKDAEANEKKKTAAIAAAAEEKKRIDKSEAAAAKDKAASEDKLQSMRDEIAETQKQQAFDQMDLEEKKKALIIEKIKLEKEFLALVEKAKNLGDGGSDKDKADLKGQALGIKSKLLGIASEITVTNEGLEDKDSRNKSKTERDNKSAKIESLEAMKLEENDNLITTSLQSIGGGGGFSMLGDPMLDEAKKTNAALQAIIDNTKPAGGTKDVEV